MNSSIPFARTRFRSLSLEFFAMLLMLAIFGGGCKNTMPVKCNFPGEHAFDVKSFAPLDTMTNTTEAFQFSPCESFVLHFAWGSGLNGFDFIEMNQTGQVVMVRQRMIVKRGLRYPQRTGYLETANVNLATEACERITDFIAKRGILMMQPRYSAGVHDGTQWIFMLRQKEKKKIIFFDNHFPSLIHEFAQLIKDEITLATPPGIVWKQVPPSEMLRGGKFLDDRVEQLQGEPMVSGGNNQQRTTDVR